MLIWYIPLKYRRYEIPLLLTTDLIFVPSGTSFAAICGGYPRSQINATIYTTCRLYLADTGKPNYPNPQLFRWHGIETFHRPHDFSVITLIKSKFHRVGTITRRRRDDIGTREVPKRKMSRILDIPLSRVAYITTLYEWIHI